MFRALLWFSASLRLIFIIHFSFVKLRSDDLNRLLAARGQCSTCVAFFSLVTEFKSGHNRSAKFTR